MRKSNRTIALVRRRSIGVALSRVILGGLGALMFLAGPLCVAQAQSSECDAMSMARPLDTLDLDSPHDEGSKAISKPDCALGCRVVPETSVQILEPVRVAYEIRFETEPHPLVGIVIDPAVPPPR